MFSFLFCSLSSVFNRLASAFFFFFLFLFCYGIVSILSYTVLRGTSSGLNNVILKRVGYLIFNECKRLWGVVFCFMFKGYFWTSNDNDIQIGDKVWTTIFCFLYLLNTFLRLYKLPLIEQLSFDSDYIPFSEPFCNKYCYSHWRSRHPCNWTHISKYLHRNSKCFIYLIRHIYDNIANEIFSCVPTIYISDNNWSRYALNWPYLWHKNMVRLNSYAIYYWKTLY